MDKFLVSIDGSVVATVAAFVEIVGGKLLNDNSVEQLGSKYYIVYYSADIIRKYHIVYYYVEVLGSA